MSQRGSGRKKCDGKCTLYVDYFDTFQWIDNGYRFPGALPYAIPDGNVQAVGTVHGQGNLFHRAVEQL